MHGQTKYIYMIYIGEAPTRTISSSTTAGGFESVSTTVSMLTKSTTTVTVEGKNTDVMYIGIHRNYYLYQ